MATAAGCQLVASCDIAVASAAARFGVNGIDVGLFCSTPMVALSRNVAPKTALDMLMTGEMIDADRALAAGLVSRVALPAELRAETERVIDRLLARPPKVLALGKRAFYEQLRMPVADAYRFASATIDRSGAVPPRTPAFGASAAIALSPSRRSSSAWIRYALAELSSSG